jgi:hypothetical protein
MIWYFIALPLPPCFVFPLDIYFPPLDLPQVISSLASLPLGKPLWSTPSKGWGEWETNLLVQIAESLSLIEAIPFISITNLVCEKPSATVKALKKPNPLGKACLRRMSIH